MATTKNTKTIAEIGNKLDCLQALASSGDIFVCRDHGRMDIYGEFITDIHIRIKRDTYDQKVWFYCYGTVQNSTICFGAAETLEGACKIIDELEPYDTEADHDPRVLSEETKEVPLEE